MEVRRFGIVHFTDGASALSSIEFWKSRMAGGAEAHVVIDRDGKVYQIRPFNQRCDHAGDSRWRSPLDAKTYRWLNSCSIGIELANGGYDDPERDAFDWARKQAGFQSVVATHKNENTQRTWEVFPEVQVDAAEAVLIAIKERYNLDDIVGHDDIAPKRKVDPGPAFPMARIRRACKLPESITA
jgi:N-acetylmuramoyl-L-alanine amidase